MNADCDPELRVMQESIARNAEKSHKWYTISEFARWATFFILGGIGTALTKMILDAPMGSFASSAGIAALSTGIIGGAIIAVAGSMISNRIYTQNQVNTSVFNARATAREIEKIGMEKEQTIQENAAGKTAPSNDNQPPRLEDSRIQGKGLDYLHTLMEAPSVLQSRN